MILLTEVVAGAILEPETMEVTLTCIYLINGEVVNKVLKFRVSPEQFKQYEQNSSTVDFGTA